MVFIKILKEFTEHFEVMPDIVVELRQNQIYFLPYQGIKKLLEEGSAQLIWSIWRQVVFK